jgi:AraC-like DNA-binding protein
VGFRDRSHFTRVFRRMTGIAPQSYRAGAGADAVSGGLRGAGVSPSGRSETTEY